MLALGAQPNPGGGGVGKSTRRRPRRLDPRRQHRRQCSSKVATRQVDREWVWLRTRHWHGGPGTPGMPSGGVGGRPGRWRAAGTKSDEGEWPRGQMAKGNRWLEPAAEARAGRRPGNRRVASAALAAARRRRRSRQLSYPKAPYGILECSESERSAGSSEARPHQGPHGRLRTEKPGDFEKIYR